MNRAQPRLLHGSTYESSRWAGPSVPTQIYMNRAQPRLLHGSTYESSRWAGPSVPTQIYMNRARPAYCSARHMNRAGGPARSGGRAAPVALRRRHRLLAPRRGAPPCLSLPRLLTGHAPRRSRVLEP